MYNIFMEMELESRPRSKPQPSIDHIALTVFVGFFAWFLIPFFTGFFYDLVDAGWYFWVVVLVVVGLGFFLPPHPKWWSFGLSLGQLLYLSIFRFQEGWFLIMIVGLLIYSIPTYLLFIFGDWLKKVVISGNTGSGL